MQEIFRGSQEHCPALSNAVEIGNDEKKGRCMLASTDIPAGALVLREKAYICSLKAERTATILCHNCLKLLPAEPIFCPICQHDKIRYCTSECLQQAAITYHKYQCKTDWSLSYGKGDTNEWRLVRLLSRTPVQDLIECDPDCERTKKETGVYGTRPGDVFTSDFRSLMSLVGHASRVDQMLDYTAINVLAKLEPRGYFSNEHGWLNTTLKPKEREKLIHRYVITLVPKIRSNNFGALHLSTVNCERDEDEDYDRPSELFIVASLINHSCWRNVFHIFDGEYIEFRAIRHIGKGEELTTNYGAFFGFYEPTKYRQDFLRYRFKFQCNCVVCSGEHKTFVQMEKEMQAFRCQHCTTQNSPAWPDKFFDLDCEFAIRASSYLQAEPLSVIDWLCMLGAVDKLDVICDKCNKISTFDTSDVATIRGLKTGMNELRANEGQLDIGKLEVLYSNCQKYLYERSHDFVDLRDAFIKLIYTTDKRQAIVAMNESRQMMRMCFTEYSTEYEFEVRQHMKLYFAMNLSTEEIEQITKEFISVALRCYGQKGARDYFRISVGIENINIFEKLLEILT